MHFPCSCLDMLRKCFPIFQLLFAFQLGAVPLIMFAHETRFRKFGNPCPTVTHWSCPAASPNCSFPTHVSWCECWNAVVMISSLWNTPPPSGLCTWKSPGQPQPHTNQSLAGAQNMLGKTVGDPSISENYHTLYYAQMWLGESNNLIPLLISWEARIKKW
uniref:Uncharacterized protein n=1 Tax=Anguilla anguilla TaxID=7936 RepID=A0A0E9XGW3_ANGAN